MHQDWTYFPTVKDTMIAGITAYLFEKSEKAAIDNVHNLPVAKDAHDIPTVIRNRWEQERLVKVRPPEATEGVEDEYDIPAFMRKKVE